MRHPVDGFGRVGAKLAEQKAAACGEQLHVVDEKVLAQHEVDKQAVEAFEADGFVARGRQARDRRR